MENKKKRKGKVYYLKDKPTILIIIHFNNVRRKRHRKQVRNIIRTRKILFYKPL
jgi:hypothetical protein